jgi:hypothetical protein
LVREVRFSLDDYGFLSDHACLYLQPAATSSPDYALLRRRLSTAIGKTASRKAALKYCLAFLNSDAANERLLTHRPTPKGSYQVTEDFLGEIPIPLPQRRSAGAILDLVTRLAAAGTPAERATMEKELRKLTQRLVP